MTSTAEAGAGTAGHLGVLDASECPLTFNTDPSQVVGLIAGDLSAMVQAVEGAEDSEDLARQDLDALNLTADDVVVGISASGRTPYAVAVEHARSVGALTVGLSCNPDSMLAAAAEQGIEVVVGPEVLTGSIRLKAGTAQKLVLNMFSTITMVRLGKTYGNLMADVRASNEKLTARSRRIVALATEASDDAIEHALAASDGEIKNAILTLLCSVDGPTAACLLEDAHGHLRKALDAAAVQSHPPPHSKSPRSTAAEGATPVDGTSHRRMLVRGKGSRVRPARRMICTGSARPDPHACRSSPKQGALMSAPASAASSIETATVLLQSELNQLQEQQEALQRQLQSVQAELASVSGNIESIRGALAALSAMPSAVVPRAHSPAPATRPTTASEATQSASTEPGSELIERDDPSAPAFPGKSVLQGSRFTEQVIAVLARSPHVALRARDVAEALGRDESAGSINAVRSTLDRLVATSRARRVGRGLYQAPTP